MGVDGNMFVSFLIVAIFFSSPQSSGSFSFAKMFDCIHVREFTCALFGFLDVVNDKVDF